MPPVFKDLSFWCNDPKFEPNEFFAVARDLTGDSVESVELLDDFTHPKKQKRSLCFRFTYRDLERTLTHEEVNEMQEKIIVEIKDKLDVEIR